MGWISILVPHSPRKINTTLVLMTSFLRVMPSKNDRIGALSNYAIIRGGLFVNTVSIVIILVIFTAPVVAHSFSPKRYSLIVVMVVSETLYQPIILTAL